VYILPIGFADRVILDFLATIMVDRFNHPVEVLGSINNPSLAFDPDRKQYHSGKVLEEVMINAPDDAQKIIGIADFDLYTPVLQFTFAVAQLGGKAGVISLFRLREEYYGLQPNRRLLMKRAGKEVVHEIGHTFGLTHCPSKRCVMHLSNSVRDLDIKPDTFCLACQELLKQNQNGYPGE
jgi:archaemetzincin